MKQKIKFDDLEFIQDPFCNEPRQLAMFEFLTQQAFISENEDTYNVRTFIDGYCIDIATRLNKEEVELKLNEIKDSELC